MKGFFSKIEYRLSEMMEGCYGIDNLGRFTAVLMAIFLAMGFMGVPVASLASLALCFYSMFRCYSKNTEKREAENREFLARTAGPRRWMKLQKKKRDNKDTAYFTCKKCGTIYSVPKGKGKIRTTCPNCHEQEIHTT